MTGTFSLQKSVAGEPSFLVKVATESANVNAALKAASLKKKEAARVKAEAVLAEARRVTAASKRAQGEEYVYILLVLESSLASS